MSLLLAPEGAVLRVTCNSDIFVVLQVVQVYTYMLTPLLTAAQDGCSGDASADGSSTAARDSHLPTIVGEPGLGSRAADVAAAAAAAAAAATNGTTALSGWELKLIMELCDEVTAEQMHRKSKPYEAAHPALCVLSCCHLHCRLTQRSIVVREASGICSSWQRQSERVLAIGCSMSLAWVAGARCACAVLNSRYLHSRYFVVLTPCCLCCLAGHVAHCAGQGHVEVE